MIVMNANDAKKNKIETSMEPHSMRNLSDNEDVTFLCCIANIDQDEGI